VGIYVNAGTVNITNTAVTSQTAGIQRAAGTVNLVNTLFFANTNNTFGTINSKTGSVTGNPLFTNPTSFDFHLGTNSPAINAGVSAGITTDYEGDTRVCAPDIGFDERPAPCSVSAINDSPTRLTDTTNFTATASGAATITYTWNYGDGTAL